MINPLENLKMVLVVMFLLTAPFLFYQNWVDQGKQKGKKCGHEYWFGFQNEKNTNSFFYNHANILIIKFIVSFKNSNRADLAHLGKLPKYQYFQ